jgi:hypothetical protein
MWYARVVVPKELTKLVGRRELRKSMNTTDRHIGFIRALRWVAQIREEFEAMKRKQPAFNLVTALFANGGVEVVGVNYPGRVTSTILAGVAGSELH